MLYKFKYFRGLKTNLKKTLNFVREREYYKGGFTLYKGVPDTKNTNKLLGIVWIKI